jgi:hypothetical protein
MLKSPHEMVRRVAVAQAVVDRWRGRDFAWGVADCGRSIVAPVLKGMGHKCPLARFGRYSSEFGARRALKRQGFDSMEAFLDAFPLMRIGHAGVLPADLVGLKGEGGWLSICVALGNGRVFGFASEVRKAVVYQPYQIEAAWRVPCR